MPHTMPGVPPTIPRGVIILVSVAIALLLILFTLVEFGRGFREGFSGLLSGW